MFPRTGEFSLIQTPRRIPQAHTSRRRRALRPFTQSHDQPSDAYGAVFCWIQVSTFCDAVSSALFTSDLPSITASSALASSE